MNTSQLQCVLHSDQVLSRSAHGVFAADRLPKYICQGGFIANTDVHSKPGKHWCAFYFDGAGCSEFFDSYGKHADCYNNTFSKCLQNNSTVHVYNNKPLQSNFSRVCGQYCIYYLIHRARGTNMKDIVESLVNQDHRDQFV